MKKSSGLYREAQKIRMTEHAGKTKPELWKEIDFLEQKIMLLEQYLEKNGLLMEATEYVENSMLEREELPFD